FGRFQFNRTSKNVTLGFKTEYFNELLLNRGRPLAPYGETAFDERFHTNRLDAKFSVNWKINQISRFNAFVAGNVYDRRRLKYFRNLVDLTEEPINRDGASDTTGFTAWMSRGTYSRTPIRNRLSYEVGYDVNIERGSGLRIKSGSQQITDVAIFSTAEYEINSKLQIKPGVRIAHNTAFRAPVVPMVSMRYKRNKYTYRLSYSQGFRAPDIKELYIEFVDVNHNVIGNTDLMPEHSKHVLLSIDGKRTWKKWLISPSLTAYYNDIKDKITLAATQQNIYSYVNISEFRSTGTNIRLNGAWKKINCSLGYGLTGIRSDVGDEEPVFRAYHEVNGSYRQDFGFIQLNVFAKYNGRQNIYTIDAANAEVTQRFTGDYTLLDLQLSKQFLHDHFQVNAGVKNLLNVGNVNNVLQSSGAHGSDAGYLAVGTGRNPFIKVVWTL
ncbi:MAG: TonB-dependent receptor, partial [Bacteroidetes bacterium]|nr:TonB-dependent receptor [Bacteroidota bacterium]